MQHREGADADIALDNGTPIEHLTLANIKFDIEESTIPLFVDVVDVQTVSKDFLDEIKKDWIEWKT